MACLNLRFLFDLFRRRQSEGEAIDVRLPDGVEVSSTELRAPSQESSRNAGLPLFVFGHGYTGRRQDHIKSFQDVLKQVDVRISARSSPPRIVVYDARGHGSSRGWEGRGSAQFHWQSLAKDMVGVAADALQRAGGGLPEERRVLLGGESMGAATAIWAALEHPGLVRGLVLYMVPVAWDLRAARRPDMERAAAEASLKNAVRGEICQGRSEADLPPPDDLRSINVPTLIVQGRGDPGHPVATAEIVSKALPNVRFVVADEGADLRKTLERELSQWLVEQYSP